MIQILQTQRKLREAAFFLQELVDRSSGVMPDLEEFGYFLSAFLGASRSVTFVLQKEFGGDPYKFWMETWLADLADPDRQLLKFMNEQRVAEVHSEGAEVQTKIEHVPITKIHTQQSVHPAYAFTWSQVPDTPPPTVGVAVQHFDLDSNPEEVISVCRRYLNLLQRLLNEFQKHHEVHASGGL